MSKETLKFRDQAQTSISSVPPSAEVVSGDYANLKIEVLGADPVNLEDGDVWLAADGHMHFRVAGVTKTLHSDAELAANKNAASGYAGITSGLALQLKNTGGTQSVGAITDLIKHNRNAAGAMDFILQLNTDAETALAGYVPVMKSITSGDQSNLKVEVLGADPSTLEDGDMWLRASNLVKARVAGVSVASKMFSDPEVVDFSNVLANLFRLGAAAPTGAYALLDKAVVLITAGGAVNLTNVAANHANRLFLIKRLDAVGIITFTENVDGAGFTLAATANIGVIIYSNGVSWYKLGSF